MTVLLTLDAPRPVGFTASLDDCVLRIVARHGEELSATGEQLPLTALRVVDRPRLLEIGACPPAAMRNDRPCLGLIRPELCGDLFRSQLGDLGHFGMEHLNGRCPT